ncbi:related to YBT1 - Vacuolar, ABC protein transporting bile acids [Ustilago trichophora]|uniref:Related to YBT1 - Vacuolar, ABC protein transporting bile acids n=1 Tax=Ustilago trichophora TaxID=86804 RepID=A0A5C3E6U0_9BASI|nr:related to YBT1 - Vacuolar, ABC protein transporting bile acids [Ustilago trichophora]
MYNDREMRQGVPGWMCATTCLGFSITAGILFSYFKSRGSATALTTCDPPTNSLSDLFTHPLISDLNRDDQHDVQPIDPVDSGSFDDDHEPLVCPRAEEPLSTYCDQASYRRFRIAVQSALQLMAIAGLVIDTVVVVADQRALIQQRHLPPFLSKLHFAVASFLHHLAVLLVVTAFPRLAQLHRLATVLVLSSVHTLTLIFTTLVDYQLRQTITTPRLLTSCRLTNLCLSVSSALVALTAPTGPALSVKPHVNIERRVMKSVSGGGSIAQFMLGFMALPLVSSAARNGHVDKEDVPALDHTLQSSHLCKKIIRTYRHTLHLGTRSNSSATPRPSNVKARTLLTSLFRSNTAHLCKALCLLVVVSVSSLLPKLGLKLILQALETHDTETNTRGRADSVGERARATLLVSTTFFLALLFDSFVTYCLHAQVKVVIEARVHTQLASLIAWKRLRQKENVGCSSASYPSKPQHQDNSTFSLGSDSDRSYSDDPDMDADSEEPEAEATASSVINLITTDVERILHQIDSLALGCTAPLEIIFGIYAAHMILGNGALVGLGVAALLQPIAYISGQVTERIDDGLQQVRDRRVSALSGFLKAIKTVKYQALENHVASKVMRIRQEEIRWQTKSWVVYTLLGGFFRLVPSLAIIVALAWFTIFEGNVLTASVVFPAVAVMGELQFAASHLPDVFLSLIQGWVSLKRISNFLESEEVMLPTMPYRPPPSTDSADHVDSFETLPPSMAQISVQFAEHPWIEPPEGLSPPVKASSASRLPSSICMGSAESPSSSSLRAESDPVTRTSDVIFESGKINLICGKTGSGKSLLLLALLGETQLPWAEVECPRSHPDTLLRAGRRTSLFGLQRTSAWTPDPSITSYVPQNPFLLAASIRDNILYGLEFDAARFEAVVFACGLKPDLAMLMHGEHTLIVAEGSNVSGGQKARISLARAIYSRAGTVLIDDCLSAVDAKTSKHIRDNLFDSKEGKAANLLHGRTTILVTHHVGLIVSRCATVLELDKGHQVFFGHARQYMESSFYSYNKTISEQLDVSSTDAERLDPVTSQSSVNNLEDCALDSLDGKTNDHVKETLSTRQPAQQLSKQNLSGPSLHHRDELADSFSTESSDSAMDRGFDEENRARGRVPFDVYRTYIQAGGGVLLWSLVISIAYLESFAEFAGNWWLRKWTQCSTPEAQMGGHCQGQTGHETGWWLKHWALIQALEVVITVACSALICTSSVLAGSRLFQQMLNAILQAPLRFHESMPLGHILKRFGQDMESIDSHLAEEISETLNSLMATITSILGMSVGGGPVVIGLFLLIAPVFCVLVSVFTVTSRDLQRLGSIADGRQMTKLSELITGVITIRAFGDSSKCYARFLRTLDESVTLHFWQSLLQQWLSFLMGMLSSIFVLMAVLLATLSPGHSAARTGFTLVFIQSLTSTLQHGLESLTSVEQSFVAVERVLEHIKVEAEPLDELSSPNGSDVVQGWPSRGAIEIRDLYVSYAPHLPDVLKGVSLSIRPGEKVALVGATGSGKTTLVSALFRMVDFRRGSIKIDGRDITDLSLRTLRSQMTIILQDSHVFSGTLRETVDPLGQHSDDAINRVLRQVGLLENKLHTLEGSSSRNYGTFSRPTGSGPPSKAGPVGDTVDGNANINGGTRPSWTLESRIDDGGRNLALGETQLLSLARLLLCSSSTDKKRIVILDEISSAVDYSTDTKMQQLLDLHFADCHSTVLTVAHRLSSIIGYDTIVVLHGGRVVEKGAPSELLAKQNGWFTELAKSLSEGERAALEKTVGVRCSMRKD